MTSLIEVYPPLGVFRRALADCSGRVMLVGGALRDYYLGRPCCDFDFAVENGAIALSRKLARRLKASFVLLDAQAGCARIVKKSDGAVWTFDLTDWRGTSIRQDLHKRDFTINALATDIKAASMDPLEILEAKGARRDIKAGRIRMVGPKAFKDDPLRLLRAFSLSAGLGFQIDARTRLQIKKDARLITAAAVERVREEIFKVLTSPRAYETLSDMDKMGLLPRVMPQITVMYGIHQGGYHHLDVWRHSLDVVRNLEELTQEPGFDGRIKAYLDEIIGGGHTRAALLKMAALLHDIGKPQTRRQAQGRTTFHGHEHAGERITRLVARQLKLSVKERYFLEDAVRMHLRPGYLSNFKRPSEKAVFRYMRDSGAEAAGIALLAMADQAATRGPLTTGEKTRHHAKICRMLLERYFASKEQKPRQRLLTGHDLINVLKLKPSELFGKILSQVEEAHALGKIKTKQEALALARKILKD
ncbi:MAG: HD domain-containing protein [Candidatus Omnitrophica bacterium]|nr:HD domain-containing protein [Candidatus Omnitrophota bacterium]